MKLSEGIVQQVKDNDRKAITDLYYQLFSPLMSVIVRYKKNVEDQKMLVNNAFMKIISNIGSYNPDLPLIPWVQKIARNEVIDSIRKEKNYSNFFDFDSSTDLLNSGDLPSTDLEIEHEYLRHLLQSLPPATNLVFNLYAIEGYTSKEICDELNIGYETVKWHIKEARKRLKVQLEMSNKSSVS